MSVRVRPPAPVFLKAPLSRTEQRDDRTFQISLNEPTELYDRAKNASWPGGLVDTPHDALSLNS